METDAELHPPPTHVSSQRLHELEDLLSKERDMFQGRERFWETRVDQIEKQLSEEKSHRNTLESHWMASNSRQKELEDLLEANKTIQTDLAKQLAESRGETENFWRRWKQAGAELNKVRSYNQGFNQVTDDFLIQTTAQLRYNIQNFAIQLFGGRSPRRFHRDDMERLKFWIPEYYEDVHIAHLGSQDKRPSFVESLIWHILVKEVFGKFRWMD